jgi:hypothetical protein
MIDEDKVTVHLSRKEVDNIVNDAKGILDKLQVQLCPSTGKCTVSTFTCIRKRLIDAYVEEASYYADLITCIDTLAVLNVIEQVPALSHVRHFQELKDFCALQKELKLAGLAFWKEDCEERVEE